MAKYRVTLIIDTGNQDFSYDRAHHEVSVGNCSLTLIDDCVASSGMYDQHPLEIQEVEKIKDEAALQAEIQDAENELADIRRVLRARFNAASGAILQTDGRYAGVSTPELETKRKELKEKLRSLLGED